MSTFGDSSGARGAATAPWASSGILQVHRGEIVAVAVVGVGLGLIALFWPQGSLLTVALIFGTYLVVSGIKRITAALIVPQLTTGMRWLTGLIGLLVTATGIVALANPYRSLIVLAWVIGIGWIAEGLIDIVIGARAITSPRWLAFVSGAVSILAGIAMFVLPAFALQTFLVIGAFLLIAVSVTTLLTLPRGKAAATAT
ncbi:HdeD family acid-resistance protein [Marisediminicola antarctica]|uniref:DUF308 domain-containing protein n=1 Tax=Marisediminicola antarctica TaxID=674079 RepID=A0A7L5AS58_9MICO|nr:DUF308 domain-containing protein [Marisediminicola antarctica]QHO71199.1 hypothetical protein BHD05_13295 [Marisediminicola antarctica]